MIPPAVHYGTFGNGRVGDCAVVAIANLEQARWPHVEITTKEIVTIWHQTSSDGIAALNYAENVGISGHKIASWEIIPSNKSSIAAALARDEQVYGTFAVLAPTVSGFQTIGHAAAIVSDDRSGYDAVMWGTLTHERWTALPVTAIAVTW